MSFKDIKGQDKPIRILKSYLKSLTLVGAYLFIGEEGIGKHLVARTLAKAINCLNEKDDSCDKCLSCLKIDKNEHPDVHFIGRANLDAIKIDSIRDLKKDVNLKAYYEVKKKVFIINDAHKLTAEAANALLKILEEPPTDTLIILITAKPALLFKTIISRCKLIKFSPLKRTELKEILKKDYRLQDNLAHFLAYFSEGRIGKALRLKDSDILREKNRIIDEFTQPLHARAGFTIKSEPAFQGLSIQNKDDIHSYLNILASWFRDIYLIKIGLAPSQLINFDRRGELLRSMKRYTLFDLDDILKSICDSLLYLEQNVNIKLLLSNLRTQLCKEKFL